MHACMHAVRHVMAASDPWAANHQGRASHDTAMHSCQAPTHQCHEVAKVQGAVAAVQVGCCRVKAPHWHPLCKGLQGGRAGHAPEGGKQSYRPVLLDGNPYLRSPAGVHRRACTTHLDPAALARLPLPPGGAVQIVGSLHSRWAHHVRGSACQESAPSKACPGKQMCTHCHGCPQSSDCKHPRAPWSSAWNAQRQRRSQQPRGRPW